MLLRLLLQLAVSGIAVSNAADLSKRVVYAINCGGPEHIGEGGIVYSADQPMPDTVDSGHGARYAFDNAHHADVELYQTERYSMDSFTYRFPVKEGHFVLILKFSEVYFTSPNKKVFNVFLNDIPVVNDLDIFAEAGGVGAAYDKYIEFKISKGTIQAAGRKRSIGSTIDVTLAKGLADNPKINAIAILKGNENGLPSPPSPVNYEEAYHSAQQPDPWDEGVELPPREEKRSEHSNIASGPKAMNPYEGQTDNNVILVVSLLVLIIPAVYLLRKL